MQVYFNSIALLLPSVLASTTSGREEEEEPRRSHRSRDDFDFGVVNPLPQRRPRKQSNGRSLAESPFADVDLRETLDSLLCPVCVWIIIAFNALLVSRGSIQG